MAEGTANPLIMALRANTKPSGAMPGEMQFFSFPWQKNGSGIVIPRKQAQRSPPPSPPIVDPPPPPPVVPPPAPPAPPPSPPVMPPVMPPRNDRETRPTLDTPVYIPDAVDISLNPPVFAFEQPPEVSISYEELVDPDPFNTKAAPTDAVKPEPEVSITYEELVDPNPWNINAPPAEVSQQKEDPEVAVTVEEIPDAEPSTLRDVIAALVPAVPVTSPAPETEPEGTVTVEEVPDVPTVSDGRRGSGGFGINTGLSQELMMLAALADMVGPTDPVGQITIEELGDFGF